MEKIFIRGLIALAPIAFTLALMIWLFSSLENAFKIPLQALLGDHYFKGLGILVAYVFIFIIGTIINHWISQKIYRWGENLLRRIPLIKTVYGAISSLVGFFQMEKKKKQLGQVVMVDFQKMRFLGFVTRENFEDLPKGMAKEDSVAVFCPLSYQIGGITLIVSRSSIHPIDMTLEEAMRFSVTAGIAKTNHE